MWAMAKSKYLLALLAAESEGSCKRKKNEIRRVNNCSQNNSICLRKHKPSARTHLAMFLLYGLCVLQINLLDSREFILFTRDIIDFDLIDRLEQSLLPHDDF